MRIIRIVKTEVMVVVTAVADWFKSLTSKAKLTALLLAVLTLISASVALFIDSFIGVQMLGIIAIALGVIMIFQTKEGLLIIMANMFVVLGIQYAITDRTTGVVLAILIIVRNGIFLWYAKKGKKPSLPVLLGTIGVLLVIPVLTWQDVFSIFGPAATIAITWGTWQNKMSRTRKSVLFGKICMVVFNLASGMFTAAIGSFIEVVAAIIAIIKKDVLKQE